MNAPAAAIATRLRELGNGFHLLEVWSLYAPLLAAQPTEGVHVQADLHYGEHARHALDVYALEVLSVARLGSVAVGVAEVFGGGRRGNAVAFAGPSAEIDARTARAAKRPPAVLRREQTGLAAGRTRHLAWAARRAHQENFALRASVVALGATRRLMNRGSA